MAPALKSLAARPFRPGRVSERLRRAVIPPLVRSYQGGRLRRGPPRPVFDGSLARQTNRTRGTDRNSRMWFTVRKKLRR